MVVPVITTRVYNLMKRYDTNIVMHYLPSVYLLWRREGGGGVYNSGPPFSNKDGRESKTTFVKLIYVWIDYLSIDTSHKP